jgi:sigma-B regulation protein RsbU (phosphoserine phosphatase)
VPPIGLESTDTDQETGVVLHVLVVDDSRLQRRILSSSLKRWGFEVTEAESGHEALLMCQEKKHRILLSVIG